MAGSARRGKWLAFVVIAAVAGAAVWWGPSLWDRYSDEVFATSHCTVTVGERSDTKTAEQANNIALIVAGSIRHDMPARAATIAVATAIQESSLRNIDYGDRDSLGLFQQRPSQGWGTEEQIMDPHYATDAFYDALKDVSQWQGMEVTDAAQAVQRSGFPLAYADHEEEGRLWASALTGNGGDVTCDLADAPVTTAQQFADRVAADFGEGQFEFQVAEATPAPVTLAGTDRVRDAHHEAALQRWAVAVASVEGVVAARDGQTSWDLDEGLEAPVTTLEGTLVTLQTASE